MPQVLHTTERGQEFRYVQLQLKRNWYQAERCQATQFRQIQSHQTLSELKCMEGWDVSVKRYIGAPNLRIVHQKGAELARNWFGKSIMVPMRKVEEEFLDAF